MQIIRILLLTQLPVLALAQSSRNHCNEQAQTALEQSYCEITTKSPTHQLPTLEDFRKNPPNIQKLLLKRDAEKYGISLPKTPIKKQKPTAQHDKGFRLSSIASCELKQHHITCKEKYYQLQTNKRNSQLKASSFSSHNELLFQRKSDPAFEKASDYHYLSHIYPYYISKMLELGLADATMSFSKFANIYWQNKLEGVDFVERFQFMYSQLKLEKSRNEIKSRYRNNYPESLAFCMKLNEEIITCDNVNQNWVYKLR